MPIFLLNRSFIAIILTIAVISCTQAPAKFINKASAPGSSSTQLANTGYITVKKEDNVYNLAKKYQVDTRALIEENNLIPPYILTPGQHLTIPSVKFHTVQTGDTVYSIAKHYHTDMNRVVRVNQLTHPYIIKIGQKLRLPSVVTKEDNSLQNSINNQHKKNTSETFVQTQENTPSPYQISSSDLPPLIASKPTLPEAKQPETSNSPKKQQDYFSSVTKTILDTKEKTSQLPPTSNQVASKQVSENTPLPFTKPNHVASIQQQPNVTALKATGPLYFSWPVSGKIISRFGPKQGGLHNDGINIAAPEGRSVTAAEAGEVVYAGNELRGYGNLLLIKHRSGYVTAYAHVKQILVNKGSYVKKGQVIGYVGNTGHVANPQLHFSIRKGRKAVNPENYLSKEISHNTSLLSSPTIKK